MSISNSDQIKRLVALGGTDEGFYVLALHSFVEGYSDKLKPGFSFYAKFPEIIDLLMDQLEARGRLTLESRRALVRIAKEHDLSNRVRHQFMRVTKEEAVAATYNFLGFCAAFGIVDQGLEELKKSLTLFDQRRPAIEVVQELDRLKKKLVEGEAGSTALQDKVAKVDELEKKLEELGSRSSEYASEIERLKRTADQRGERLDELRKKLFDISGERDKLCKELEENRDAGEYLRYLERFTHYTRTRLDYERSVMKLTDEQEEAVGMIRDSGDYIVKGGAGTGKTLVLLHALERYLGSSQARLDLEQLKKVVLLTYTNTLVKYSRYLAHVVGRNETMITISTADSHVFAALKAVVPGAWIDFKAPASIIGDFNATSFLSDAELATEIEDVIWGNLVTREEYLEKHILRRGMKQPLSAQQRQMVWSIQEKLAENLFAAKRYTRNLACATVLGAIEGNPARASELRCERIFIDEAQDLSTAIIRCLKELSGGGAILAADDGQSIYKIGAQYQRAGLAVAGHTRILRSNFRNTRQIHELAERFLAAGSVAGQDERGAATQREGPTPELVTAKNEAELMTSLLRYVELATGRLGYDPENIGILAPSNAAIDLLKDRLAGIGRTATSIKDDKFDFMSPGILRLSTLHSSKGVEFPVVLIYAPSLSPTGDFDEKSTLAMQRNLLYVALTRAMDHVVVFTLEEPNFEVLKELIAEIKK